MTKRYKETLFTKYFTVSFREAKRRRLLGYHHPSFPEAWQREYKGTSFTRGGADEETIPYTLLI